jgi:hypothetical protein
MKRRAFLMKSAGAGTALLTSAAYGIPGIRDWIMQQHV